MLELGEEAVSFFDEPDIKELMACYNLLEYSFYNYFGYENPAIRGNLNCKKSQDLYTLENYYWGSNKLILAAWGASGWAWFATQFLVDYPAYVFMPLQLISILMTILASFLWN